ncbi:MAG: asparagine synthase-related protein, partial [Sphaerospermopsis kisseleviana]
STQEIFLARDRLGIKPLCYSLSKNRLVFASELQALRQLNTFNSEIDLEALDLYLHLQYIPPPQSIYKSIKKLPPAHTLTVSANGEISDFHCYWQMQWQPDHSKTEDEWIEILDSALNDAVKSHLVSDVPFGAFLSG